MPASSGEDLQARMRHLLEAIAQNNPDLASDALFPREGYVSARTGPQPEPVNHYGQPPRRSLEEKCGMKVSAPCGLVQFSPTQ